MSIVIALGIIITLATGIPVLLQMRNQPRGLIILFFAEMWERFSYYGMRAILIFYLTQHFLFSDEFASGLYGSYASLVYLLPLIGGLLADRYLGTRKAIAFGALLLVAGHGMMAVEGRPATQTLNTQGAAYELVIENDVSRIKVGDASYTFGAGPDGGLAINNLPADAPLPALLPKDTYEVKAERDGTYVGILYLALSLIIMGVGFLKPNISSIVGQLYPQGDPRRDQGFNLYYYGINLGAFWASILCGYLGQTVGWWAGFGLAGVGMLVGFIVFVLGKPLLEGKGEPPNPAQLAQKVAGPVNREGLIYIAGILGVGVIWWMVQSHTVVGWALGVSTFAALAYIAWFVVAKCDKIARERMMLAVVLIFGSVVFWTLFEQAGTSLSLFADRNVDLALISAPTTINILGQDFFLASQAMYQAAGSPTDAIWIDMGLTAAQTGSFNAGFILIFAPIFGAMWLFLGRMKRDPNPVMKFGLALAQVGLGFLVVVWAAKAGFVNPAFQMPLLALAALYLLHTTGELFLSPVGLSEITKLSVASIVSFMMAVWFLSSSIAHFIGGVIAGRLGSATVGGQVLDPEAALQTSLGGFHWLGWTGVGLGVVFVLISFLIKHWAHGANDASAHPAPAVDGDRQSTSH
jgi:POT family proton-dependent oligopeptide transporter